MLSIPSRIFISFNNATTVSTRIIDIEPSTRTTPQKDPTGIWPKCADCHMSTLSNFVDYAVFCDSAHAFLPKLEAWWMMASSSKSRGVGGILQSKSFACWVFSVLLFSQFWCERHS